MFQNQIPEFPDFVSSLRNNCRVDWRLSSPVFEYYMFCRLTTRQGRKGIPPAKPDLTNAIPDLYPGKEQGWGVSLLCLLVRVSYHPVLIALQLTFMLSDGPTGRSPTTGHWAGLPNLFWWCDRAKGVAGMICSQILPFADPQVLGAWVALEAVSSCRTSCRINWRSTACLGV